MIDVYHISSKMGQRFNQSDPPTLVTQTMPKGLIGVSLVGCDTSLGETGTGPREDAFVVGLAVRQCALFHYSAQGLPTMTASVKVGDVMVHDLSRDPVGDIASPFRSLMFYFPRSTLDWVADAAEAPRVEALFLKPGTSRFDSTLKTLGGLLLSAFENPHHANRLFVDHILFAAGVHMAQSYGGLRAALPTAHGGLAAWQKHRAKEILSADLTGDIALAQLAGECGLSLGHFARAFRKSIGVPPHQWLQQCRIDRAKLLLRDRRMSLPEIALASGFGDQSHFTRIFKKATGTSPGAWRRQLNN
jgi:AraC family transcriptional regulator